MRYWFCLFLNLTFMLTAYTQGGGNGRKPRITGQNPLNTDEDIAIAIALEDLEVRDRDDWFYPWGFTLKLYAGENYTFTEHTVTPAPDFQGTLSVPVTVNDGDHDSKKFNVTIQVHPVNDPPVITGQAETSTNEDHSFTLSPSHFTITDPDDNQFSLMVSNGPNYSLDGNRVIPAPDFNGTLSIPVKVNDGEAASDAFNLQVTVLAVNDAPRVTGQVSLESEENQPITIRLSHLTVTDPDDTYPGDFTLSVLPSGNNRYTTSGNQVTPPLNFEGVLSVNVRVNDGEANSETYPLQLTIIPGKNGPVITGQTPIRTNEDEAVDIEFSHFTVSDTDNNYPDGFTLRVLPGKNYTSEDNVVTPQANFHGPLTVNTVVNDGTNDSNLFGAVVEVSPVNDAPEITALETEPLSYTPGKGPMPVSETLELTDVDNTHLKQAGIGFKPGTYRYGIDELIFENTENITGTFEKQRGILTLTGRAKISEYAKAIRSVQYEFRTDLDLPFETKILTMVVNDDKTSSETAERMIKGADILVDLDIPTAFTPNGDSANDTWSIKPLKRSEELANAVVRIYNKKGQLLFEASGFEAEWDGRLDGKLLPADTYYYTIDLNLEYSRTLFKGLVTILR